jgi:competence protein ComEC
VNRLRAGGAVALAHPRHLGLLAVVAGLLAGSLPRVAAVVLAVAAGIAALGGGMLAQRRLAEQAGLAVVLALLVLLAAALAGARLAATSGARLAALSGEAVRAEAVVLEPVRDRGGGPAVARVELRTGAARGEVAVMRVRAAQFGAGWPEVGEIVTIAGRVAPLGRYDAYQRARGAARAIDVGALERTGRRRGGLMGVVDTARRRAEAGLDRGLRPDGAALMRGMVLGQDERLEPEVKTDFQQSGLAHLLAASGANVMLLATLVIGLATLAGLPLRLRLGAAMVLVALYVPLAGGGPSIQRAGVMGAAGLVAGLAGRPSSRWYAFGLSAAVTLVLNPRSPADAGWQLSFAAVLALLALAPALRGSLVRRLPGPVADAVAITIAATLGTAPLIATHFEQLSLASLPANLAVAPAVAPIMWLGMLAAALAQASPALAAPVAGLASPLLTIVGAVAHAAGSAPFGVLPVRLQSPGSVGAAVAATAAAAAALRAACLRDAERPLRPRSPVRVRPALLAVAGLLVPAAVGIAAHRRGAPPVVPGEVVVSFLDIGQGDATLIQHGGASILVDTGPPEGQIVRRLREAGVSRLDVLVLTHAQLDHEGAGLAVVRAFAPRLLIDGGAGWPTTVQHGLPAAMRAEHTRELDARAGEQIALAGIRLRVLWPPAPPPGWRPSGDPNNRAVVALVRVGTFDLLLTADAESDITGPLHLPPVDALKVAHHGSADPGLPALLQRLRPSVAAIEVGRHNDYGHPTASTLAALRVVPNVIRTDQDGTVRLRVSGETMRLEKHR